MFRDSHLFLSFRFLFKGFLSLLKGFFKGALSFFKGFLKEALSFLKGLFNAFFEGFLLFFVKAFFK